MMAEDAMSSRLLKEMFEVLTDSSEEEYAQTIKTMSQDPGC